MAIFTSSFFTVKDAIAADGREDGSYMLIDTAVSAPQDFLLKHHIIIDMSWRTVNPDKKTMVQAYKLGYINWEQYVDRYIAYLDAHKDEILYQWEKIKGVAKDKDIILLCWEWKFPVQCHRDVLKAWLTVNS